MDPIESRRGAWHQSTLESLLDGCSWQYYLTYVLGLPAPSGAASVAGTGYHKAIELYERGRMDGVVVTLDDMLVTAEAYVLANISDMVAVAEARQAVTHWYDTGVKGGVSHRVWLADYIPVAIEPYFRMGLVDDTLPIAGWIDGVYKHTVSGEYIIVDHKTANNLSRWGHDGALHRAQATMYSVALLLSPDYPEITTLLPMVYLVSRKTAGRGHSFEAIRRVTVQPDMNDVNLLGGRIVAAESLVRDGAYIPKPWWPLCSERWCPHYEGCQVTGDLLGTPEEVRVRITAPQ